MNNRKSNKRASLHAASGPSRARAAPDLGSRVAGTGKLSGKIALITGGESPLGRAVAELFAREGAEISISCRGSQAEAVETKRIVESHEKKCVLIPGDQSDTGFCIDAVERTLEEHGGLDILVNNAASSNGTNPPEEPFGFDLMSTLLMTRSALFYLSEGSVILNTIPFDTHKTMTELVEYLAARFAITNFTRTLARELASKRIRVNAVAADSAPGIEAEDKYRQLEPERIAPSYLFLACADSSSMTGQVLYPCSGDDR